MSANYNAVFLIVNSHKETEGRPIISPFWCELGGSVNGLVSAWVSMQSWIGIYSYFLPIVGYSCCYSRGVRERPLGWERPFYVDRANHLLWTHLGDRSSLEHKRFSDADCDWHTRTSQERRVVWIICCICEPHHSIISIMINCRDSWEDWCLVLAEWSHWSDRQVQWLMWWSSEILLYDRFS